MVAGSPLPWEKGEERVKERGIGVRAISCALDSGRPPGDCVDQLGETAGMTPSGVIHRPHHALWRCDGCSTRPGSPRCRRRVLRQHQTAAFDDNDPALPRSHRTTTLHATLQWPRRILLRPPMAAPRHPTCRRRLSTLPESSRPSTGSTNYPRPPNLSHVSGSSIRVFKPNHAWPL